MALPRIYKVIQDSLGNTVPQVQCSVFNQGTAVLATLWQNDAGTIPQSNPIISSANYGSIAFYVLPGHFDLTFVKAGYTFEPVMDMQVPQDVASYGTMAQQNANAVAITGGEIVLPATNPGAFRVADAGASPQYGFRSLVNTGTQKYNFMADGTAPNYFAGMVLLGLSVAIAPCAQHIQHLKATSSGLILQPKDADTGAASEVLFLNLAASAVGSINTTATVTAYNTTSDSRLKHAITALTGELEVVRALRPVAFRWNADGSPGVGFLAHEVAAHVQGVITGDEGELNPDGTIKPQMIDYSKLVPFLVGAVQTLAARVAVLEDALGI